MSNKSYGLGKEREAKKMLEDTGWSAYRSRGSFGMYDIISMHPLFGWKLVQIKATKQKNVSYKREIDEILKHKVPKNTQKELWIYWSPMEAREKKGWERIVIE